MTDGTHTADITFYQPIAYTSNAWTEMVFDATVDPADSGYFYYGDAPECAGSPPEIQGPGWTGAPATLPALSYWQNLLGDYVVDRIQIEYGWWATGTGATAYIDDFEINSVTYPLETTIVIPPSGFNADNIDVNNQKSGWGASGEKGHTIELEGARDSVASGYEVLYTGTRFRTGTEKRDS